MWFSEDWAYAYVEYGSWSVDLPEEYEAYKYEIEKVVNENVPAGCCGGCA